MTDQTEKKMIESGQMAVARALEKLDPAQQESVQVYQLLIQQLGEKIARKLTAPGTIGVNWEHGASFLDSQAPEVVEEIMRRFFGEMGLSEFVAFCASMSGYQAGVAKAKGFDLPDEVFTEAGKIFEGGMRLIAVSSEQVHRSGLVAMVPGAPQKR